MSADGTNGHIYRLPPMPEDPHWWLGHLAAAIRRALNTPRTDRGLLERTLTRFEQSTMCSDELRSHLRGEKRP